MSFLFSEKIGRLQIRKARNIFLFGILPSKYSGRAAGRSVSFAQRRFEHFQTKGTKTELNGFAKTIFLGKGFGKTSADFPPAERGLGNECGRVFGIRF